MKNNPPKINCLLSTVQTSAWLALLFLFTGEAPAAEIKTLHNHVPAAVARLNLKPLGRLQRSDKMPLVIGLPLRNQETLTNLLQQLYDPTSTNFHRYLTPAQFTERFGPTEQDYLKVVNFAKTNQLEIRKFYQDRVLLAVEAPVGTIERAFHVHLLTYQHPTEARQFFAPDVEPSVDADVPIISINGLNNFYKPHPMIHLMPSIANLPMAGGSAPDGSSFIGNDFRNAYAPNVALAGSGQMVGLVEGEGYYASDITAYENAAGLTAVNLINVPVDSFSLNSSDADGIAECSLDIEMAIAMAPGLDAVVVFESTGSGLFGWSQVSMADILSSMVSWTQIKQFSSSWTFGDFDQAAQGYLVQMACQGQSFFMASGDGDAWVGSIQWPQDDPNVTSVGGTTLTMVGSGTSYASEAVWNWHYHPPAWHLNGDGYWGSGGGVSTSFSIPSWQQGVDVVDAGGSATMRNIPDVALTADNVWITDNHTTNLVGGTSCAAPLWAGFTALINQQAAANGQPPVGFLNPALYLIAKGPSYNSCFHDITDGDNTWPGSPSEFYAVTGYDLCTGLGTPNGINLINAFIPYSGAVWVDYNYSGTTQNGSYDAPYKTLAQGVTAVSASGNIWFKTSGSKLETMTITKPMTIRALNGPATVGQ